jgi:prepilin-type N-terminal cleavage/methylation domain-containing protein
MAAADCPVHHARTRGGFTLLEVMLAVAILVIITVVVVQFTELTLQSAEISSRDTEQGLACNGLRHLLAAQFAELPVTQDGALVGMNIRSHGNRRDAMQIVCPSGNGLLTPDAKGYYQLTLVLREIPRGSGKMVLGLERQPWTDDDDDDDDDDDTNATPAGKAAAQRAAAVQKLPSDWVPLLAGVQQLEIAYFDARLNSWVDRWTDQEMLPNLVRVRLTLGAGQPPYELVERVPNGGLKRLPPPVALPNVNGINRGVTGQPAGTGVGTAVRNQPQS